MSHRAFGRLWLVFFSALFLLFAPGCGDSSPPATIVRGKITKGGQPLKVDKAKWGSYATVQLRFHNLKKGGDTFIVSADEQGAFELTGPTGEGIPSGKYQIAVYQWNPSPDNDLLQGAFAQGSSPITREIQGAEQEINIDLDHPEG